MSRRMACSLAAAVGLAVATPAAAGLFDGSPPTERPGFIVVENTFNVRPTHDEGVIDDGSLVVQWQLGYLHNVDDKNAWGGAFKLTVEGGGHTRFGPVLRYRRWLDESTGLDVGLGAYYNGDHEATCRGCAIDTYHDRVTFPSPTLDVGVSIDDWIGIHVGVDVLLLRDSGTHVEPSVGVRFGRLLALLTTFVVTAGTWSPRGF